MGFRFQEGADLADRRAGRKDVIDEQHILSRQVLGSLEAKRSPQVAFPGADVQSELWSRILEATQSFEDPDA